MISLVDLLKQSYGAQDVSLHPLNSETGKAVYRIEQAGTPPGVLRVYPSQGTEQVAALAAVLQFLESQGYPAERVLLALDGSSTTNSDDRCCLLTTFIAGTPLDYSAPTLYHLGAALGRLHALGSSEAREIPSSIPAAGMRPAGEIAYALGQLTGVAEQVPSSLRPRYETLLAALHDVDPDEGLPQVLIHNDCHPGNGVRAPEGHVVLIDWEGAGWGSAAIDLGFLLSSIDTQSPWTPPLPPDMQRVNAVVDGYYRYHCLSPAELDWLPNAIRFRALVYGVCSFAASIGREGREDPAQWWWQRYLAADDISERARRRFELHNR